MQAFYYVDGIPTKGLWIDLETVNDTDDIRQELIDAELITEDYDGDLLVADIEGDLPRAFYSSQFDHLDLAAFMECRDDCDRNRIDYDAAAAYLDWIGSDWSLPRFQDAYQGEADSETAYAEWYADEIGLLDSLPENLRYYFDFEKFGNDLFISDLYLANGHVFNRNA